MNSHNEFIHHWWCSTNRRRIILFNRNIMQEYFPVPWTETQMFNYIQVCTSTWFFFTMHYNVYNMLPDLYYMRISLKLIANEFRSLRLLLDKTLFKYNEIKALNITRLFISITILPTVKELFLKAFKKSIVIQILSGMC